jgi:hypothetical protein
MASAAAVRREAEYNAAMEVYRSALDARKARLESHRKAVAETRGIFSTLASFIRLCFAHLSSKPRAPVQRTADRDEVVWSSGNKGEKKVGTYLSTLSDDWILVSGYRNAKGEIDQILLGSRGVFAIEIKFINGVVHCDGDRWWSDKYDRYGNLVETNKPLVDKRGRGPSKQLNDSVDLLQSFLSKRANISRVHRVVVLSHDSSLLGDLRNITVDVVATIDCFDLERLFSRSSDNLDSQSVERVLQMVKKDHNFYEKPRPRREQ